MIKRNRLFKWFIYLFVLIVLIGLGYLFYNKIFDKNDIDKRNNGYYTTGDDGILYDDLSDEDISEVEDLLKEILK